MRAGDLSIPDVLVVAVDGNCQKFGPTKKKIDETIASSIPSVIVRAIPDPHVERWLLLDSNAFRQALGIGCNAPDNRCERDRYKYLLASAVSSSGVTPLFSGLEHAREIVRHMDIERVAAADSSFGDFVGDAKSAIAQLAAR